MADTIFQDIESRVGKDKSFNLLYKGTHNVDVEEFHVKCDGKGPTVTILYGKYNTIFGGYTSKSWSSDNKKTKSDKHAFLFYKKDNVQAKCIIMPIKPDVVGRAITCDEKYGPTFGGGPLKWQYFDLQTFKKEKSKKEFEIKDTYIHLNGCVSIGHAYDVENVETSNAANYTARRGMRMVPQHEPNETEDTSVKSDISALALVVKRIEVYQVVADQLPVPWRKKPKEDETQTMKKRLENFEPHPGLGLQYHNILLIGAIGSGKSSFYNTLATVFAGEVKTSATSRDATMSVTNEVHAYVLRSKTEETIKELNLRIFDIRGFEDERGYDHELELLLDGKLQIGYVFPDQSTPVKDENLVNASLRNEIHLVAFVTGTSNLDLMTDSLHKRIEDIQKRINIKGLPMVVVATRFDELCPKIGVDPDRVYKSPKARDATKTISNFFGIHEKHIFPIVNYTNDEEVNCGKDRLALQALDAMVKLTKDYLENHKDMAKNIDNWCERASSLHIPVRYTFYLDLADEMFRFCQEQSNRNQKLRNEKEVLLMQMGAKLSTQEENLRFLCIGAVDSGKTTFIDSMASALRDEICSKASGGYAKGKNLRKPFYSLRQKG